MKGGKTKKDMGEKNRIYTLLFILTVSLFITAGLFSFAIAQPFGASVNVSASERANSSTSSPGSNNAQAGNVTELILTGKTITQSWQGYYGNVTGLITLEDASGDVFYNWSGGIANPSGEVYASMNQSIAWNNIQCFNFSASGSFTAESGNGGTTNLYGINLSTLNLQFNMSDANAESVNATFGLYGAGTHDEFFTAGLNFTIGECRNTRIYSNSGQGESDKFEEVLLYEPTTASVVFAALLENDLEGFDQRPHDFEMLVLEDGHNTDSASTPYYFFMEIN